MARALVSAALLLSLAACGIVGPRCVARQERGTVATISGSVASGEMEMHRVLYDTRGSQNDVTIEWPGQRTADGTRLIV